MIFITGDCHHNFERFNTSNFPEQKEMTRDDFVIILGDFGLLWDGSNDDKWWRDWFSQKPFTLLFLDGNHENFNMLYALPEEEWHGGMTHVITPNIRHLMRGQIFDIGGQTFFVFGGGQSHDIKDGILDPKDPQYKEKYKALRKAGAMYRIKGVSWWEQEMPSAEEYEMGIENLDKAGWKVDCILTHCAPTSILGKMDVEQEPDILTEYLETIRRKCSYKKWFFGHYHAEKAITQKDVGLYKSIVRIV